jgi:hypothetical protein
MHYNIDNAKKCQYLYGVSADGSLTLARARNAIING